MNADSLSPLPGAPRVSIHADRPALGLDAAEHVVSLLAAILTEKSHARVIFACAPSQDEFLAALVDPAQCGIALDWSRITAW